MVKYRKCFEFIKCPHAWLTFLGELDVSLPPPVAVFHVAGVVAQIALLQRVDGQRDGNLLLPEVLPDCPAGDSRECGKNECRRWKPGLEAGFVVSKDKAWGLLLWSVN